MDTDSLLKRLHALENWLEHAEDRRSFPLRWGGRALLVGVVFLSNVLALVRWPFAALARWLGAGEKTPEGRDAPTDPARQSNLPANKPIEADGKQLKRLINGGHRVLVDFWAEWCGPCLMVDGLLEEFAESSGETCLLVKVNTMSHGDLAEEHDVKGLPTLILFEHGEEVRRHAGTLSRAELKTFVHGEEASGNL
ncbi:MAG: thioredoxin family protein [Salinibacter sp.]